MLRCSDFSLFLRRRVRSVDRRSREARFFLTAEQVQRLDFRDALGQIWFRILRAGS
jgi:hypothetical protein